MAGVEEKVKAAWATRFGVGKAPEALVRACAEKTAGMDSWQADLEIDALVDAHVRRYLADRITGLGAYLEKALKTLDGRLAKLEGPDGVESVETGMRLAERLDLKLGNRLDELKDKLLQKLDDRQKPVDLTGLKNIAQEQARIEKTLEKQSELLEKAMARETRPERVDWLRPVLAGVACVVIGMITGGFLVYQILKTGGASVW